MNWSDFNRRYKGIHPESSRTTRRAAFTLFLQYRLPLHEVRAILGVPAGSQVLPREDPTMVTPAAREALHRRIGGGVQ